MDKDLILQNELNNDGQTINLYFNYEIGLYVAFGFSAFFVVKIIDVLSSFSEELEMPVALLRKKDVEKLRLSTVRDIHEYHSYYKLLLEQPISLEGYHEWGSSLKW